MFAGSRPVPRSKRRRWPSAPLASPVQRALHVRTHSEPSPMAAPDAQFSGSPGVGGGATLLPGPGDKKSAQAPVAIAMATVKPTTVLPTLFVIASHLRTTGRCSDRPGSLWELVLCAGRGGRSRPGSDVRAGADPARANVAPLLCVN